VVIYLQNGETPVPKVLSCSLFHFYLLRG
jgi:hypothetical protein